MEEDKFGDDLIRPTSFYSAEHEKTKLNWFCYEVALSFELKIQQELGERLMRYRIYEEQIADFSVYCAKQMKGNLFSVFWCLCGLRVLCGEI